MSSLLGMIETRTCWISLCGLHRLLLLLLGDHGHLRLSNRRLHQRYTQVINTGEYLSMTQNAKKRISIDAIGERYRLNHAIVLQPTAVRYHFLALHYQCTFLRLKKQATVKLWKSGAARKILLGGGGQGRSTQHWWRSERPAVVRCLGPTPTLTRT